LKSFAQHCLVFPSYKAGIICHFFIQKSLKGIVILLVYVDDIVVIGLDQEAISTINRLWHSTFHVKDLGQLTYFLGLEIHFQQKDIFVNQHKYIQDPRTIV